jgi:hypothetical protein
MTADAYHFLNIVLSEMYSPLVIDVYADRILEAASYLDLAENDGLLLIFDKDFRWRLETPEEFVASGSRSCCTVIKAVQYMEHHVD